MIHKKLETGSLLAFGIFFITIGFLTCVQGTILMELILTLISIGLASYATVRIIGVMIKRRGKVAQILLESGFNLLFATFIEFQMPFILRSITIVFGLYILINSILHFINYFLYRTYHIKGSLGILFQGSITFIFSMLLVFKPTSNMKYAEIVIGIYMIFLGFTYLMDFIREILPVTLSNHIKSRIKVTLPLLFTAFLPKRLLSSINEMLEIENDTTEFNAEKSEQEPDIEVIIHLAKSGSASMGHVEIAFENKVYSYGNYNKHSRRLFDSIGDGIVCIADLDKYIRYVIQQKDRYLVTFGLVLTPDQKEKVRLRINRLITIDVEDYYPDLQLHDMGLLEQGEFDDMSSDLYKVANAKFKRITSGKHKKFFVMKTNCAMVADYILGSLGKGVIAIHGIIAPGTYYDYLNSEFLIQHSNVITRKVYTKNDM